MEGIFFDVVVFDSYPELYGMNFAWYGIALIFLIYTIVWIVKVKKRGKRRAGAKQSRGNPKIATSTTAFTLRAEPKTKSKAKKRKNKR